MDEILGGSVFSQTVYTPEEAAVWGPGGEFGGELYFLAVVTGLPKDSLLDEGQRLLFRFTEGPNAGQCFGLPTQSGWCVFGALRLVYPMEAYDQTANSEGIFFRRLHFGETAGLGNEGTDISGSEADDSTRTFVSSRSIADDFSGCTDCGPNNPPDLSEVCGFQARWWVRYQLITGDWALTGEATDFRGYRYGTGYKDGGGGITVTPLGSGKAQSNVKC